MGLNKVVLIPRLLTNCFSKILFCTILLMEGFGKIGFIFKICFNVSKGMFSNSKVITSTLFVNSLILVKSSYCAKIKSSQKFFAGASLSSVMTTVLIFNFLAADASRLPNCPPPIIPRLGIVLTIVILVFFLLKRFEVYATSLNFF